MWLVFPIKCDIYALDNFKHASIEINAILELNFPTISNREYDPHKEVRKVIATSSIKPFTHERNKFDDIFEKAYTYSVVMRQEA